MHTLFSTFSKSLPRLVSARNGLTWFVRTQTNVLRLSLNDGARTSSTKPMFVHNQVLLAFLIMGLPLVHLQAQVTKSDFPAGTSSWTTPAGVSSFYIECWGAGGNGGASFGGNGGNYAKSITFGTSNLGSMSVTVGSSPGGNSSVIQNSSTICTATGGRSDGVAQTLPGASGWTAAQFKGGKGGSKSYYPGGGGGSAKADANGGDGGNGGGIIGGSSGAGGSGEGNGGKGGTNTTIPVSGSSPGGGGGGAFTVNNQTGANGAPGLVKITYFCDFPAGSTTGGLTIPYPQEGPVVISNLDAPGSNNGVIFYWESSPNGTNSWTAIGGSEGVNFTVPQISTTTWYRRISSSTGCGSYKATNPVAIKVLALNGSISGKVVSPILTPVEGITIKIKKVNALPGSPASWEYTTTTGVDGTYSVPVYYGDKDEAGNNGNITTQFVITPSKAGHTFNFSSLTKPLSNLIPILGGVDFTDNTVYSITGKAYQECVGCQNGDNTGTATVQAPLDSVEMRKQGLFFMKTGYLTEPAPGDYGRYATTVSNPGTYTISASYKNHQFLLPEKVATVAENVAGFDFKDTTTRVISGYLTAGCGDYIGLATIEFQDVLTDQNGNPRPSVIRKRTLTDSAGRYSIRLPARKYKAKVVSFTPDPTESEPVTWADLEPFFISNLNGGTLKTALPYDSLLADITLGNKTLNLTYRRPPTMLLTGMDNEICSGTLPFVLMPQLVKRPIEFSVWEGTIVKGCPVMKDSVKIYTNIQVDDENEPVRKRIVKNGYAKDTLKGGYPNTVGPDYYKTFNARFTDAYGRSATDINKNVVVTGVKADSANSFSTQTPGIPILVLHDPPGDKSFSSWEQSNTNEQAIQFSVQEGNGIDTWAKAKVGAKIATGIGVSVENEVWGSVEGQLNLSSKNNNTDETILTSTFTHGYSTNEEEDVVGSGSDVFVGGSFNILYANSTEIAFANCGITKTKNLLVSPDSISTTFIYTDHFIRTNTIPNLYALAANPGNTPVAKRRYLDKAKMWQQALANNELNKIKATYDKNISFDGNSGTIPYTTTSTSTSSSTFEFEVDMDASVASELGFETGGAGLSGGVTVKMQASTGKSTTNTTTKSTTIKYVLDDNNANDNFSVNVMKDPVYSTPVFQTVSGQSSCPPEANTLPLDQIQMVVPVPVQTNLPTNVKGQFYFQLTNISTDAAAQPRNYLLSFDQASNSFAASVSIGGSPWVGVPTSYSLSPNSPSTQATVEIGRNPNGNVYSYEGLHFTLSDACTGDVVKHAYISASFLNSCSDIVLQLPENGFIVRSTDNNTLSILLKGYDKTKLTSVDLEYSVAGTGAWSTAFTKTSAQLSSNSTGTTVDWALGSIADGTYKLRLKLICASGITYTPSITGVVDRSGPTLVGNSQPSDDVYSAGDEISFTYNEDLKISELNNNKVVITRLSNNGIIPVSVTGSGSKLVILPLTNLLSFTNERIRVIVQNVPDVNGNTASKPDTAYFDIGTFVPAVGAKAVEITLTPTSILESGNGTLDFKFSVPSAVTDNDSLQINFSVAGSALYGTDYTVAFSETSKRNYFNGVAGSLVIPKNKTFALLRIDPKTDSVNESNETVVISLLDNPRYLFGTNYSTTGNILDASLSSPTISGLSKICLGSSTVLTATRTDSLRYANRLLGFSSEYSDNAYGAIQALGAPNEFPNYGDFTKAWASASPDDQREYLHLGFGDPAPIDFIDIFETYNPGAVDTVYVKNPNTNSWQMVYSTTASAQPAVARKLHITFAKTSFPVSEVRIAMNSPAVPDWNEIDAVGIGSISNNATFKWSNGATTRSTTVNTPGTYTCTVTNSDNGLVGKSEDFIVTTGTPSAVFAGADQSYDQSSGNKYLGAGSPTGGTWSGSGVTGTSFNTIQTSGVYPVRYCYTNPDGCSACDTVLVTIRPPVGKCDIPLITPGTGTYISTQTVSISCKTPGALIYYTITGNNPNVGTVFTKLYTVPFKITNNVNIRAMAVKSGLSNSGNASVYYTIPTTANPVISPATGTYAGNQTMTLTSATAGASIYYTLNGNLPRFDIVNSFTKLYTGPVTITGTVTVWAVAKHPNYQYSSNVSATISIPPVRFNPPAGTYAVAQNVTMTNTTAGAQIYYTTNGQTPVVGNGGTTLYSGPVFVPQSGTLKAISWKNSAQDGLVASANYVITNPSVVANPVFSPGAGVCAAPCAITIMCATVGADVYYTTNGNTPTQTVSATNKKYSGPISLTGAATIKAKGFFGAYIPSAVVTASYTLGAPGRIAVSDENSNENLNEDQALTLFPNPTSGAFTIRGISEGEKATIQIWNAAGKRIYQSDQSATNEGIQLNVNGFPAGLYHVEVLKNNTRNVLRIVKE